MINSQGDFFTYVENELIGLDDNLNESFKDFKKAGDITPSLFSRMIFNYDKVNLQDDRIRLFMGIVYLQLSHNNRKPQESYK
jgi:hypothetical protein